MLRPPLAPFAFALSLAACAGHLGDAPVDRDDCVDAAGYAVPCPAPRWSDAVVPDEVADPPGPSTDTNVAPAASPRSKRRQNEEFARYEFAPEGDPDAPPFVDYRSPAMPDTSIEDGTSPASCKITKRVRRRAERHYYGDAGVEDGKLAPLTDARICEIEEHLRHTRRSRRAR